MMIYSTPLPDLMIVESIPYTDMRGEFSRLFCDKELAKLLGARKIVQINLSQTNAVGTVRGIHYQRAPFSEMKLVRCIKGRVWDVAVDFRYGSCTFLHWHAQELSAENHRMMVIPEGFAHGFQCLEPKSELIYLHTSHYTPEVEGGVRYNDPRLGINWPHDVTNLSERDANHPLIDGCFRGIIL